MVESLSGVHKAPQILPVNKIIKINVFHVPVHATFLKFCNMKITILILHDICKLENNNSKQNSGILTTERLVNLLVASPD